MPTSVLRLSNIHSGNVAAVSPPEPFAVVPSSLKRKRPPKIEIPNVLQEIGPSTAASAAVKFTPKNCRSKSDAVFSSGGFGVGVCSVKGKKSFMEDTHVIISSSNTDKGFFGVYDGHGGSKAAEFAAKNLHKNVFEMLEKCSENTTIEEAVKAGFMKTDDEFLKQGLESGACCVTVLIENKEIVISNVGDCRAVLSKKGKAEALTKDHTPSHEDERKRIEDKGGYVELHRGTWRVHGVLAVSRSIGDAHLKDWVLAEPETKILPLSNDMEFLVLASDGLWDEVGNQEAIDVVMRKSQRGGAIKVKDSEYGYVTNLSPKIKKVSSGKVNHKKQRVMDNSLKESENSENENNCSPCQARRILFVNQPKTKTRNQENEKTKTEGDGDVLVDACKELVKLAMSRGSLDDITVMIVDLKAFH